MADNQSVISDSHYFERRGSLPHMPTVPIRLVIGYNSQHSESEASGCTFVTPQPRRRRPSHAAVQQYPHRQYRKVSAPPELQAHLGSFNTGPVINLTSATSKGGANHEPVENTSPSELIINLSNVSKLGVPEGLHSGSDSGVPSEYSSWAPISSHCNSLSPYEDVQTRSISGSLEELPSSESLSDTDDEMGSPRRNHKEHISQAPKINIQSESPNPNQPLVLAVNAPPPLNRANTDSHLLNDPSPVPSQTRQRTNSMVFQLNLANALPGASSTLPNARSVSMFSLNTAGNTGNNGAINYPNLSALNIDNQSIYSDAGAPAHITPGLLNSHLMGSQGSLSGIGYPGLNGNFNTHQPHDEEVNENPEMDMPAKHKWLLETMSRNVSTMYAILLFMIGVVLYVADIYSEEGSSMGEAFNVYLIVVQLVWFIFIHIDIRQYIKTITNALQASKDQDMKGDQVKLEPTPDGQYQIRINLPEPRKSFPQHYGFTSGRHAGSLYLKMGAAVFCLGYLIHSGLNLGQKILYITEDNPIYASCTCFQDILMSVLQPVYAFYQLFFIFKFSNLIINRRKRLSRFALMHCISASFLFWVYAILQETLLAINSKKNKEKYGYQNLTMTPAYPSTTASVLGEEFDSEEDTDDYASSANSAALEACKGFGRNFCCNMELPLSKMINETTPYLFPFTIEYNILIVGIWILLWENIGRIDRHTHLPSVDMTYDDDNTNAVSSNLIIYIDCHSSNRGLFAGLFMTVATVISIILFFIFSADENTKEQGLLVNGLSELIVLAIMIIAAILAFASIRHLDVMKHSISKVDDIMLYICLPCIFLYAVFTMVPAISYGRYLFVAVSVTQIIQAVLQTTLICDGLRRCSNSHALTTKKPGRELITFLIVANLALWLLETFEIKSEEGNYYKYKFYGKEIWTLLSHSTLPLALFYRFHSSVCLVDIWKAGYEPEPEH